MSNKDFLKKVNELVYKGQDAQEIADYLHLNITSFFQKLHTIKKMIEYGGAKIRIGNEVMIFEDYFNKLKKSNTTKEMIEMFGASTIDGITKKKLEKLDIEFLEYGDASNFPNIIPPPIFNMNYDSRKMKFYIHNLYKKRKNV